MICTLLVAAGARWEPAVVGLLAERRDVTLLKRCVDVDDLLATATVGQAEAAVVALDAPGLDLSAADHLRRHGVRPVAVLPSDHPEEAGAAHAARLGITAWVRAGELTSLPDLLVAEAETPPATPDDPAPEGAATTAGQVVVVWGPQGAPGRTTLACALAAELSSREVVTTLVDADPWGSGVAQQLGVLDQASGLLTASRLSASGALDQRFESLLREVPGGVRVLTGLPRPDRWVEVRGGTVEHVLEVARSRGTVVVDTGFSLEDDPASDLGGRPGRNSLTLGALAVADQVLVVGTADPVGLARLARGLVDLREVNPRAPRRVVVNRDRPSLGWARPDVVGMVEGFARLASVHFLPEDQATVDRALVSGRAVRDVGESALADAVAELADQVLPGGTGATGRGGRFRRRRAGTARRR
jgi:MinD-like ATPase involved in chromosome partitioning or flagellar assembly